MLVVFAVPPPDQGRNGQRPRRGDFRVREVGRKGTASCVESGATSKDRTGERRQRGNGSRRRVWRNLLPSTVQAADELRPWLIDNRLGYFRSGPASMPKHVPSFKHLLASPATPQKQDNQPPTRSVNDLLATSRITRQLQNEAVAGLRPGETLWTPTTAAIGLLDVDAGAVHPAEVARRRENERMRAGRAVAGPAPPPSWASPSTDQASGNTADGVAPRVPEGGSAVREPVTTTQLLKSSSLFTGHRPGDSAATPTLVEYCLRTVLRYLNDHSLVTDATYLDDPQGDTGAWTIGALLAEQVPYLDTHLKVQLLDCHALLPEGSPHRLTDQNIMMVLSASQEDSWEEGADADAIREESVDEDESNALEEHVVPDEDHLDTAPETPSSDWDHPSVATSIRHLLLTLHPSPISLLRRIKTLHSTSLTSLNLAYSTITDLERLVGVLPVGLRELGLCGIRVGRAEHKQQAIEAWRRGLSALSRKMIVLKASSISRRPCRELMECQMLDLSESPFPIIQHYLTALLFPASRLPSLRLLSLRGSVDTATMGSSTTASLRPGSKPVGRQDTLRSDLLEVIRGRSKERYVEVIWS